MRPAIYQLVFWAAMWTCTDISNNVWTSEMTKVYISEESIASLNFSRLLANPRPIWVICGGLRSLLIWWSRSSKMLVTGVLVRNSRINNRYLLFYSPLTSLVVFRQSLMAFVCLRPVLISMSPRHWSSSSPILHKTPVYDFKCRWMSRCVKSKRQLRQGCL